MKSILKRIKCFSQDNIYLLVYLMLILNLILVGSGFYFADKLRDLRIESGAEVEDIESRLDITEEVLLQIGKGQLPLYQPDGENGPLLPAMLHIIDRLDKVEAVIRTIAPDELEEDTRFEI